MAQGQSTGELPINIHQLSGFEGGDVTARKTCPELWYTGALRIAITLSWRGTFNPLISDVPNCMWRLAVTLI
jgi:hypothetical protein